jgi:hypothetical protein
MINCLKIVMAFMFLIHPAGGELASNFETTSLHTQEQENCLFRKGLYFLLYTFTYLLNAGRAVGLFPWSCILLKLSISRPPSNSHLSLPHFQEAMYSVACNCLYSTSVILNFASLFIFN